MIENKALLDFLTESGLLGIDQSERLVRESETTRQRVEDIIHEKRLVDDIEVAKIKSKIYHKLKKKVGDWGEYLDYILIERVENAAKAAREDF